MSLGTLVSQIHFQYLRLKQSVEEASIDFLALKLMMPLKKGLQFEAAELQFQMFHLYQSLLSLQLDITRACDPSYLQCLLLPFSLLMMLLVLVDHWRIV